jgi:hypothetical protein
VDRQPGRIARQAAFFGAIEPSCSRISSKS